MSRIQCVTLGCSKNRVDSEHLLRQLQAGGMEIAPESENLYDGKVDVVILNTCGFIQDAKEESIEAILDAVQAKQEGQVRKKKHKMQRQGNENMQAHFQASTCLISANNWPKEAIKPTQN